MRPKAPAPPLRPLRRVLILAPAPANVLDLAGPAEVFAQASRLLALLEGGTGQSGTYAPLYAVEVAVVPARARDVPSTTSGVALAAGRSRPALVAARRPLDFFMVAGGEGARPGADEPDLRMTVRVLARRASR